jgi:OHCU decarboxylase
MSTPAIDTLFTEVERIKTRLAALNDCAPETACFHLKRCCSSSKWADQMVTHRPFSGFQELQETADRVWAACAREDYLEAFAAHPRIGERSQHRWSQQEQSGVAALTSSQVEAELTKANGEYEAKFGYIFMVCATGKSALEILDLLKKRLANAPDVELQNAAEEQRLITRLRLRKLLGE